MFANDPIVKEAFVSISINSGLSLKRKVLVTTVLMTTAGTFVFLKKKYPLIKLVKNKLYTIAYPIFIKIKACKAIFRRINSTSSNKTYKTSEFFESRHSVQPNEQISHNFFRSKSDFFEEFK